MSKTRKNLLRSSLVMLLVATVALSTATYAWFTSGKTAAVTGLEFTATSASGIQMSVDKSTWKSSISASDITKAQTTALQGNLTALSSSGNVTSGALDIFSGSLGTDGKLTTVAANKATTGTGAKDGYYSFDMWFQNAGNESLDLYLCTKAAREGETTPNCAISTVANKTGATAKNTELAIRIATIAHDAADTAVDTANGKTSNIWEPNSKTHTAAAKAQRHVLNGTTGAPTTTAIETQELAYVGFKTATTEALEVKEGCAVVTTNVTEIVSTWSTEDSGDMKVATLPANKFVKVTFYVWIEGQDADCQNDISAGTLSSALNFYALTTSA